MKLIWKLLIGAVVLFLGAMLWSHVSYKRTVPAVLRVLMQGYGEARWVRQYLESQGASVSGAFYSHLQEMERAGLVRCWTAPAAMGSTGQQGVFYAITDAGMAYLRGLAT